uniref:Uncharacterized protein n=1 Tax=Lygus hesperus TaxID=30085 RepID=A0A146L7R1_LYGHE
MAFGKILFTEFNSIRDLISSVRIIGNNRIQIETVNGKAANSLLDSNIFTPRKLRAYIPDFLIHKTGVIRHVDPTLTDTEILKEMRSPVTPISSKSPTPGSGGNVIVLQTCFVTFDSQSLPEFITIYGTRCKVEP